MASVHSSRAKVYERKTAASDEPTKHLESEGERLIKEMVLKQTGTQVSLAEQLQQKKHFEKATEFVPLTKYSSGEVSLKEFQGTAEKASCIEELKSFGLADEEIEMVFDHNIGEDYFFRKHKKMERSVLEHNIQRIFSKIENGRKRIEEEEAKQRGMKISRHEQELGLAVKPESEETKLFQFALSCQKQPTVMDPRPPEHPINQLKELEKQMFGHLKRKKRKKAKKRPVDIAIPAAATEKNVTVPIHLADESEKKSLWDKKELPSPAACSKSIERVPVKHTCKPQTWYTVRDGKVVTLTDTQPPSERVPCSGQSFVLCSSTESSEYKVLSQEDIQQQRLTVEEITQLPRFHNYETGTPSKVLYVKNLAKQVKEADLVSVFAHLENPDEKRIMYRLMAGKMKGQAFVTFPSVEKATTALRTANGFLLHGKPMVLQYGKLTSSEEK